MPGQVRVMDTARDARSVFFYTDDNPYYAGLRIVTYGPKLHPFISLANWLHHIRWIRFVADAVVVAKWKF